ncbi:MAG: class I SAM-dependent methyltransferase [Alphaproteobacteria bacterium]
MLGDILQSGVLPRDQASWRAECLVRHRIAERRFLLDFIPPDSSGAELGVFTGLFSAVLARESKAKCITFVDPWWLAYGDSYPSWGAYTAFGTLSTKSAYDLARARISKAGLAGRSTEAAFSYDWLNGQPDRSLDWVYLDSTHSLEGTRAELKLLDAKLTETGVILGDDWQWDQTHRHHGVSLAVNEFVKISDFEFVFCGLAMQWMLRRKRHARIYQSVLVRDQLYSNL